ncbi:MAG TPA: Gfo/Idh/MocA family oxidoreductase, partial [Halanaerobiales bacterium]|nr:Gfo/Idh/MocA family oxidoreductase [Halanaerobiales bacterium]
VEIAGEEGKLTAAGIFEWTGAEDKYLYLEKDGEVEKIRVKGREQYLCEVEAFVRAINENNKAPLDPRQDALNNMKVIDAMFESARRNIPVKII